MEKLKLPYYFIIIALGTITLSGCGVSRLTGDGGVNDWIKQRSELAEKQKKQTEENSIRREEKAKQDRERFERENPEVPLSGVGGIFTEKNTAGLRSALNAMPFVTRYPDTDDLQKVYVKVGEAQLSLKQIIFSIGEQIQECQRVTAYSGYDIESYCYKSLESGLDKFAAMLKDADTPQSTKRAAVIDGTIGNVIYFDHAARLAKMHNEMCRKQNENGYVTMITVSAPCRNYKGAGI
ncbi:hypothetical protein [Serratia grimesii]|uniref:hypothetical protein n=1 Tax=Serratia grimesii TaxID=82995 RepID=UPI0039AEECE9